MFDDADLIWNRACTMELADDVRDGDRALLNMIEFHSLVMNGGVKHALETHTSPEAAVDGFRYFGLDEVASFIATVRAAPSEDDARTDQRYAVLVPSDGTIETAFRAVLEARPDAFAAR